MATSCGHPTTPPAGPGLAAPGAPARSAARFKVLETTTACACHSAQGSGGFQGGTLYLTVVDDPAGDDGYATITVNGTVYVNDDPTVVITLPDTIVVSGTFTQSGGPATLEATITATRGFNQFSTIRFGDDQTLQVTGIFSIFENSCAVPPSS